MLKCGLSGAQIGADIGALRGFYLMGLETKGWMPQTCLTKAGMKRNLLSFYNMKECEVPGYAIRTDRNVRDSDATIRFAVDFKSPGEICTLNSIKKYKRPYLDINLKDKDDEKHINSIVNFLNTNKVETLNVAGNALKTIEERVMNIMIKVIKKVYNV